jgi:hypothetical protein
LGSDVGVVIGQGEEAVEFEKVFHDAIELVWIAILKMRKLLER